MIQEVWIKIQAKIAQNRLMFFVGGAIFVAFLSVVGGIWLYQQGGTAQLDLSRPSYQEAREQAKREAEAEKRQRREASEWNFDGNLTRKKVEDFEKKFSERQEKIRGSFFDQKTLSDETLNLTDENQETE